MNIFRMLFAAGVMSVSAIAAPVTPKQDSNGCFLIGTADELEGFAKNVAASGFSGCAKLTADIHYLGNADLLNSSRDGVTAVPQKQWTPLQNFAGTFDGQDHTIYGLYASSSTASVGFIGSVSTSATVSNLRIADSYFYNGNGTPCSGNGSKIDCSGAGGIVGSVPTNASLTLEKSGFAGYAGGASSATNGGLVGAVGTSAKLFFTNSYNEGVVNGGGLIGATVMKANLEVHNCYNIGSTEKTSPLVGPRQGNAQGGLTVDGERLGCVSSSIGECTNNFTVSPKSVFVSADPAAVIANYWTNIYGGEGGETSITNKKNQLVEDGMAGLDLVMEDMEITYLDPTSGKEVTTNIKVPVAKIKITLDDNQTALVMPENLDVYGVIYDREFTENATSSLCDGGYNVSTTVLPFTMDVDSIDGGTFYKPSKLFKENETDQYWTVGLQEVTGNIEAHQPYIVCPTKSKMTFKGSTIVKQTDGTAGVTEFNRDPIDPAGAWKFVGLYKNKTFSQDVTVDPETGREYAFTKGNFVRKLAGYSTILRAYLLAPAGSNPNDANVAGGNALAKTAARIAIADIEENPSQINVKIIGTDYEPFAIASINEVEGEDGGTLAIKRPLIFPMNGNHNGSWKDIKGRNLNGKPSAKGVYLHNGIPAVTK